MAIAQEQKMKTWIRNTHLKAASGQTQAAALSGNTLSNQPLLQAQARMYASCGVPKQATH
jgi:hypothetical protein